ncbi:MAG: C-GCAxxG-C-C family protein, partial [Desulfopila sp.]|nr:C-GCAxxG-C-C family protein [Desulfopila sp.]
HSARQLHDTFRAANGATCCRVLSGKSRCDSQRSRFRQCADLTANAAEMAATLIITERPELIQSADHRFLRTSDSCITAMVNRLLHTVGIKH